VQQRAQCSDIFIADRGLELQAIADAALNSLDGIEITGARNIGCFA
jgi:hypothetical protein